MDSDDEVNTRKRKKKVYWPEDLASSDDSPIATKPKKVKPSPEFPMPPKRLIFPEVAGAANVGNLTPGKFLILFLIIYLL